MRNVKNKLSELTKKLSEFTKSGPVDAYNVVFLKKMTKFASVYKSSNKKVIKLK
jgi:hypothetical protein